PGGLIPLDRHGNPGFAFNTARMAYGFVAPDGSFLTAVCSPPRHSERSEESLFTQSCRLSGMLECRPSGETAYAHVCERENLLPRDARDRHCAFGRVLQGRVRLDHPEAGRWQHRF